MLYLGALAIVLASSGLTMLVALRLVVRPRDEAISKLTYERNAARKGLARAVARQLGCSVEDLEQDTVRP